MLDSENLVSHGTVIPILHFATPIATYAVRLSGIVLVKKYFEIPMNGQFHESSSKDY